MRGEEGVKLRITGTGEQRMIPDWPARRLAILWMTMALAAGPAGGGEKEAGTLVSSFESQDELGRWQSPDQSASVERSAEHATHGTGSARVTFHKGAGKYASLRVDLRGGDGRPADWSRFRALRLDVFNPFHPDRPKGRQRSDARLDFHLKDARGGAYWYRCALSPWASPQTLDVPLTTTMSMMSAKEATPFAPGAVVGVGIATKRPEEDLVLFFDNLRLLPKEGPAQTVPPSVSPSRVAPRSLGADFTFVQFYHPDYPYEEKGFFRRGRGPIVLRLAQPGTPTESAELPELLGQVSELRRRDIPFHVILFNFWYGRSETYEEATARLRGAVAAIQERGGDLFRGVWLHELSAITRYRIVAEQEGRLAKADAYTGFVRRFIADLCVPPNKLVIVLQDHFVNYGLDFEAGADAVVQETLFQLDNIGLCMAQARGMARSFGRGWGGDTARYTEGPATARYNRDGSTTPVPIDFFWWKTSDVHKAFIEHYYNGVDILRGQSERPWRRPEDGPMFEQFLTFVEKHPRAGEVVAPLAVVRSKGDYWAGADLLGSAQGLADWVKAEGARQEERDFLCLNAFFPGFSKDGCTAERYWTGTPYGPIDIIYPSILLQAMKRYDVLIFMGFHRMDSVRPDFLADLMRYVEEGGTILLAADSLRMKDETFASAEIVKRLIGAEVREKPRPIAGPIQVTGGEALRPPQGPVRPDSTECPVRLRDRPWRRGPDCGGRKRPARAVGEPPGQGPRPLPDDADALGPAARGREQFRPRPHCRGGGRGAAAHPALAPVGGGRVRRGPMEGWTRSGLLDEPRAAGVGR